MIVQIKNLNVTSVLEYVYPVAVNMDILSFQEFHSYFSVFSQMVDAWVKTQWLGGVPSGIEYSRYQEARGLLA